MGLTGFLAAVAASMLGALARSEIEAWAPALAARLIRLAVSLSPPEIADRLSEEWCAHVNEVPGFLGKIIAAVGFIRAARALPGAGGQLSRRSRLRKRTLDLLICMLLAPPVLPILLLAALAVRLDSAGPALVRRARKGAGGREFFIYTFRSTLIYPDEMIAGQNSVKRLTRTGLKIRQFNMNVLLEFISVLRGDMTWVGPRPRRLGDDPSNENPLVHTPGVVGLEGQRVSRYGTDWSILRDVREILRCIWHVLS